MNVLPSPGVLASRISPPSSFDSSRLIAKPKPVPPYLRDVEPSACWNASKMICCLSGAMPMPVSVTENAMTWSAVAEILVVRRPAARGRADRQRHRAFVRELERVRQTRADRTTGLARLVRGFAVPAMENVALWHERDISHSSVERFIAPDATITLDFALSRLTGVVEKLVIYPQNMRKNLDRLGGLVHSQRVLLALTQKNVSREDSYSWVQRNAMKVWRGEEASFLKLLKADPDVRRKLSDAELESLFDDSYHFKHVDTIFQRVFG